MKAEALTLDPNSPEQKWGKHPTKEGQVKLAITLLVGVLMPFGLVVLAGVVASRMLARYHRQRRSDGRTSGHGASAA